MMHKDHGFHIASGGEIEVLEKAGWKECTDEMYAEILANKFPKEEKRRGRPPKDED